ncbi:YqeG family HAD IIIA-type phosphatase [Candidatus Woesearchaeota archaeon]|nr:YqeG family HAD IIIA-type phosphatase [Candidatus Woesearchaeota archaeon]
MHILDKISLYLIPDRATRNLCTPNATYSGIADISLWELWCSGIRGIIFDRDGTLTRYHSSHVPDEITKKLDEARRIGFNMCGLSNAGKARWSELEKLGNELGFPMLPSHPHAKPEPSAFFPAMDYLGHEPGQIAVVGDRIFTDILGGNRVGAYTILVDPFPNNCDPLKVRIPRWLENRLYK